jgi:hypothetical protein
MTPVEKIKLLIIAVYCSGGLFLICYLFVDTINYVKKYGGGFLYYFVALLSSTVFCFTILELLMDLLQKSLKCA